MSIACINGTWILSDIVNNCLFTRRYIGYSKKAALTAFKYERKIKPNN
jgi:hypothetical protein